MLECFTTNTDVVLKLGGSAGAGSVRALLGSPPAIGKYQQAIAMSSLGGGVDLGLHGNYGHKLISVQTADLSDQAIMEPRTLHTTL